MRSGRWLVLLMLTCGYPQPQPVVHDAPRTDAKKLDAIIDAPRDAPHDAPHDTSSCGANGSTCAANTDCCSLNCSANVCAP